MSFGPKSRGFGPEVELGGAGNRSAPRYVTLKNPKNRRQNVTVAITGVAVTAPSGDFAKDAAATTCGTTLAPGASCKVAITFSPTGPGLRTGALMIATNASLSPAITVPLAGNGQQGRLRFRPHVIRFGREAVNSQSDSKVVTLFNKNPVPMALTIGISGPFVITSNVCPSSLPANGTCQVGVAFAPTTTGKLLGALTFTDKARNSPQSAKLIGVGQ